MKLNSRRVILAGLAFLSITAFWQLYDFVIPLILRDSFLLGDAASGWVMAADNILAIFILPIFGRISDRTDTPIGRRMPFILTGTVVAAALMFIMPRIAFHASTLIEGVYTGALDAAVLDGELRKLFRIFISLLAVLLFAMGIYRSPAVALMPDITPKPLRSKANAIINLMGTVGGIITLVFISVFTRERSVNVLPEYSKVGEMVFTDYTALFAVTALVMIAAVAVLFFTIKENKLRVVDDGDPGDKTGCGEKLPADKLRSLILILLSVFFWYMGYNAVTTAYSRYFVSVWGDVSGAASCLTIAMAGAVASYIPVGVVSSRFGRKRVILAGVVLLGACFAAFSFIKSFSPFVYALFVLVGVAWASINVNSYPMVVEISRSGDVGKYTGYYYTFSMAGQIATPIISGFLLEHVGYHTLFPYAACMVAVAFVTMIFVRHGDSIPEKPKRLYEHFNAED